MRMPSITVNKSSTYTLPWLQVPDLALFLALAAQKGGADPLWQNKLGGSIWSPSSEQSGVREEEPSALQGAAAQTLTPLQRLPPNTCNPMIHLISPSKCWAKFKSCGVQTVPPLLSEGLKRKPTGPCITFPWTRQAVPGGGGHSKDSTLSYFAIAGDCLHTLGTSHQK